MPVNTETNSSYLVKLWLLSTPEAAKFLGVSPGTLSIWRCTKRYDLPYIKLGHLVKYDITDLENFVESRKVRN